jgi:hypothetical protein
VRIVDATAAHLRVFYPNQPKTCRAWAVVDGERLLGVCGYFREGPGNVVFTEIGDELRRHPRLIVLAARLVLAELLRKRLPVFAVCDQSVAASANFLRHFGFAPTHNGVYQWQI